MPLDPVEVIRELNANPEYARRFGAAVREKYEATLHRLAAVIHEDAALCAFDGGQATIQTVAGWVRVDSGVISQFANGKLLEKGKKWSQQRLLKWSERLSEALVCRGILVPADDFNECDVSEATAKFHHDRVLALCKLPVNMAILGLVGATNEAEGVLQRGSNQAGRMFANALMGWVPVLEGAGTLLAGVHETLLLEAEASINLCVAGARKAAEAGCVKHSEVRHRCVGYGGYALARLGMARRQATLVADGEEKLRVAVRANVDYHGERDFHWMHCARLVELHGFGNPAGVAFAKSLSNLLQEGSLEVLAVFWKEVDKKRGVVYEVFRAMWGETVMEKYWKQAKNAAKKLDSQERKQGGKGGSAAAVIGMLLLAIAPLFADQFSGPRASAIGASKASGALLVRGT
ncbi:MAG: hypothetical protein CMJ58_12405 [Planctomycetaceae bacterium]|nr:hypothetical protein [Planctomycetaceae bacterium]